MKLSDRDVEIVFCIDSVHGTGQLNIVEILSVLHQNICSYCKMLVALDKRINGKVLKAHGM